MGLLDGFIPLAKNINRARGEFSETEQGVASTPSEELTLDKSDEDLAALAKTWQSRWDNSEAKKELLRKQDENERYWLGNHYTPAQKQSPGNRDLVDNLVFEAEETFLPVATKKNPEPVVTSDNTPEGRALAKKVSDRLVDLADTLRLKLKLRKATRHWSLYYLGAIKVGWSMSRNEIAIQVRRPQQLILDPDAMTDECEYDGEFLGDLKTDTARDLIARFPSKTQYITDKVNKKLGTKLRYVEWWTADYLFWSLDSEILGKSKNPHWNYDGKETKTEIDDYGTETSSEITVPGMNHFASRKIPYAMLSVFNLGKNPFDDTTLIEQVLPLQDKVNKRQRQIDKNADQQNGGAVVSGDSFTKEQAKQVSDALRRGATVWVPRGRVDTAYKRDQGAQLPQFIYNDLVDTRNEVRNVFGTTGLSSQGLQSTDTVRGKILVRGADGDRAAPIVDHLEQLADYVFNWFVQLMMVYYDEPRNVSRSQGATTIVSSEFTHPLVISVKEGSLIPRDRLTERNEAIDLWTAQALDPISLFERLDFPNPRETAKQLFLWKTNPAALFPELAPPPLTPEMQNGGAAPAETPQAEPGNILETVPIQ